MANSRRVSANPSNLPQQVIEPTVIQDPEDLYYDGSWPEEDGR